MKFDAWLFSAKLAWDNLWIRWLAILTVAIVLAMSAYYLWRTLPSAQEHDFVVMHYNVYLGIDDVRSWPWIFFLPTLWILLTLADIALAFGFYRADSQFSLSLILSAFAWSLPWAGALFYLSIINL